MITREVATTSGTAHERVFFHVLMVLVSNIVREFNMELASFASSGRHIDVLLSFIIFCVVRI